MKKVTIFSKSRVFDGFFKIDDAELAYERFDGTMSPRLRRLCFERGDSVAAVVYNRDSRTALFVNQFKYPTYDKGPGWILELVAGMQDRGEDAASAIKREIREEMGYAVQALTPIGTFYVSPGGSSERIVLFYAEVADADKRGNGGGVATEGEDIETVQYSIDELDEFVQNQRILDAKTLVGVLWLLNRRRIVPGE